MSIQNLKEKGIIYCVTGKKLFLKEAYISIKSIRKFNKNILISIFIDEEHLKIVNKDLFDSIFIIKNPEFGFGDKIYAMKNTPYKRTIYLDCDTVFAGDIPEIFEMLKEFDISVSNPPFKNKNYKPNSYQAGIIFYRMNKIVHKFLNLWDQNYDRINHGNDQPSFRQSLSELPVSLFIFPSNYNFRAPFASYINGKIKIIHDHNLSRVSEKTRELYIKYLNNNNNERYWFPKKGIIEFPKKYNFINRVISLIEKKILNKINSSKYNILKKKIINYYIIKSFPWLINWVIPDDYRNRMIHKNEILKKFLDTSK